MEKRKQGRKNPAIMQVHTGQMISKKLAEQRVSKSEISRKLNRANNALTPLLRRPSMQAYLLWELSLAMEYDFFSDFSLAIQQKHPQVKAANVSDKATIAALEKELAAVKEERDYLKKMIGILAK